MEFQQPRPGTGRPDTARAESSHRPLTAQSRTAPSSKASSKSRASVFDLPPVEAGSYSQHPPPQSARSNDSAPRTTSHDLTSSAYFTRDVHATPRTAEPDRPTTAQLFRPHTLSPGRELYSAASGMDMRSLHTIEPIPELRSAAAFDSEHASSITTQPHAYDFDFRSSSGIDVPLTTAQLLSDSSAPRPASVNTTSPFADTLVHDIPPLRELPFKRPESHRSASDRHSSRPASAMELPPLRKPVLARDASDPPARPSLPKDDRTKARPSTGSPPKRDYNGVPSDPSPTRPLSTDIGPLSTFPPTQLSLQEGRTAELEKTFSPMGRSRLEVPTSSRVPRLSSLADAPHEIVSPPRTAAPPSSNDRGNAPRQPAKQFTPTNTAVASLEDYASQTREDRAAALEEFMISNLESNAFTTLCHDIENCWQRIALGL